MKKSVLIVLLAAAAFLSLAAIGRAGQADTVYSGYITGMKFADANNDGLLDSGDVPIKGWKIYLEGSQRYDSTLTDAKGRYSFGSLAPGVYFIREEERPKWIMTYPTQHYYIESIFGPDSLRYRDFGNYRVMNPDTARQEIIGNLIQNLPPVAKAALRALQFKYIPFPERNNPAAAGDGSLPAGSVIRTWDSSLVITLATDKYFFWLDMTGDLKFAHPCMFALVDKATGEIDTIPTNWWPVVHGALDPPNFWFEAYSSWDARATSPDTIFGNYQSGAPGNHPGQSVWKTVPGPRPARPASKVSSGAYAILIGGKAESPTEFNTWQHDLDSVKGALTTSVPQAVDPSQVYMQNDCTDDTLAAFLDYVKPADTLYFYFTGHGDSSLGGGIVLNHTGIISRLTIQYSTLSEILFDSLSLKRLQILIDASNSGKALDKFLLPKTPVVSFVSSTDPWSPAHTGLPTDTNSVYTSSWRYITRSLPLGGAFVQNWRGLNDTLRVWYPYIRANQNPRDTSNAPYVDMSASSIAFPDVAVGGDHTENLTVTNKGWIDLRIDSVVSSSPMFSMVGGSTALIPRLLDHLFQVKFSPTSGGFHQAQLEFYSNGEHSPDIVTVSGTGIPPADTVAYRTFIGDSLTTKAVKRKAYGNEFVATFTNLAGDKDGLYVKFSMATTITNSDSFATKTTTDGGKSWKFSNGTIHGSQTVGIFGIGAKGSVIKVTEYKWFTLGVPGTKQPKFTPPVQRLLLPMPNFANVRDTVYKRNGFAPTSGLLVGVAAPESAKTNGWIRLTNTTGLKKFFPQTGTARGFDVLKTSPLKAFTKEQKNLKATSYTNHLSAQVAALKLAITTSAMQITPLGLGELIYEDEAGNPLNGRSLRKIAELADTALTFWRMQPPWNYTNLDTTITRINNAFAGPMDTVSFGSHLIVKGVHTPLELGFIHADPGAIPERIVPASTASAQPEEFALYQCYPNPFNPTTTIAFNLTQSSIVTLKVYNLLGQEVATLIDRQTMDEGEGNVEFNAGSLASGVYFYRLVAEALTDDEEGLTGRIWTGVGKMMLLK